EAGIGSGWPATVIWSMGLPDSMARARGRGAHGAGRLRPAVPHSTWNRVGTGRRGRRGEARPRAPLPIPAECWAPSPTPPAPPPRDRLADMDTARGTLAAGTPHLGSQLARHLREGRLDSARHAVGELCDSDAQDEALEVVAHLAPTDP